MVLQSRIDISIIPLEHFLNCKVQLNMVAWQTDRGTLSLLSERGTFGPWERSFASASASDCASASSTQSLFLTFGNFTKWVKSESLGTESRIIRL